MPVIAPSDEFDGEVGVLELIDTVWDVVELLKVVPSGLLLENGPVYIAVRQWKKQVLLSLIWKIRQTYQCMQLQLHQIPLGSYEYQFLCDHTHSVYSHVQYNGHHPN